MESKDTKDTTIGFIGQGFIGKSYADDFENRGYDVYRYAKEASYTANKDKIRECDIVFIAVPTPTTPNGFDSSIVREVIKIAAPGTTVVIKSTLIPGTTEEIQEENPELYVMHSPEFLSEATAAYDAAHPDRNIVGIPIQDDEYERRAKQVLSILPQAEFELVCSSREAELIKYSHNIYGYINIIYTNMLYDISKHLDVEWEKIQQAMDADPMVSSQYINPIHKTGRGAGGNCFIKDFEAFLRLYEERLGHDAHGLSILKAMREKNNNLLLESEKDLDILEGVYGNLKKKK